MELITPPRVHCSFRSNRCIEAIISSVDASMTLGSYLLLGIVGLTCYVRCIPVSCCSQRRQLWPCIQARMAGWSVGRILFCIKSQGEFTSCFYESLRIHPCKWGPAIELQLEQTRTHMLRRGFLSCTSRATPQKNLHKLGTSFILDSGKRIWCSISKR
jgi:hypothetical protein